LLIINYNYIIINYYNNLRLVGNPFASFIKSTSLYLSFIYNLFKSFLPEFFKSKKSENKLRQAICVYKYYFDIN